MYGGIYKSTKPDPTFGGLAVNRLATNSNYDLRGVIQAGTPKNKARKAAGDREGARKPASKKTTSIKLDIRPADLQKAPGSLGNGSADGHALDVGGGDPAEDLAQAAQHGEALFGLASLSPHWHERSNQKKDSPSAQTPSPGKAALDEGAAAVGIRPWPSNQRSPQVVHQGDQGTLEYNTKRSTELQAPASNAMGQSRAVMTSLLGSGPPGGHCGEALGEQVKLVPLEAGAGHEAPLVVYQPHFQTVLSQEGWEAYQSDDTVGADSKKFPFARDPFSYSSVPAIGAEKSDQVPLAVEYQALSSTWFNGSKAYASALGGRQLPNKLKKELPRGKPKKTWTREEAVKELIRSNNGSQATMARQMNRTHLLPVSGGSGAGMLKVRQMQYAAEKRAQLNEGSVSNQRNCSPKTDQNAARPTAVKSRNEQRGSKSEVKLRQRKKQVAAFRLNGIPLPDQNAVHFASVGSFPYKTAYSYPIDHTAHLADREAQVTTTAGEAPPTRSINLKSNEPVVVPSARQRSEGSEMGSPLELDLGTALLPPGTSSPEKQPPSTLKKPEDHRGSMRVLEAKVASFTDSHILKASLTFSQAGQSRQSVSMEKIDKSGTTPKPAGDNSELGSRKSLLEIKLRHPAPIDPCKTPDVPGQRRQGTVDYPAKFQGHRLNTQSQAESPSPFRTVSDTISVSFQHTQTLLPSSSVDPRRSNALGNINDDSSDEHSAQQTPLVGRAVAHRPKHVEGGGGAKSSTQLPLPRKEAAQLVQPPIFEQNEWPYGAASSSGASSQMRRTLQAHQRSMDSISQRPYEAHRSKKGGVIVGLNHDISSLGDGFKELKPTELNFSKVSGRRPPQKKVVMSQQKAALKAGDAHNTTHYSNVHLPTGSAYLSAVGTLPNSCEILDSARYGASQQQQTLKGDSAHERSHGTATSQSQTAFAAVAAIDDARRASLAQRELMERVSLFDLNARAHKKPLASRESSRERTMEDRSKKKQTLMHKAQEVYGRALNRMEKRNQTQFDALKRRYYMRQTWKPLHDSPENRFNSCVEQTMPPSTAGQSSQVLTASGARLRMPNLQPTKQGRQAKSQLDMMPVTGTNFNVQLDSSRMKMASPLRARIPVIQQKRSSHQKGGNRDLLSDLDLKPAGKDAKELKKTLLTSEKTRSDMVFGSTGIHQGSFPDFAESAQLASAVPSDSRSIQNEKEDPRASYYSAARSTQAKTKSKWGQTKLTKAEHTAKIIPQHKLQGLIDQNKISHAAEKSPRSSSMVNFNKREAANASEPVYGDKVYKEIQMRSESAGQSPSQRLKREVVDIREKAPYIVPTLHRKAIPTGLNEEAKDVEERSLEGSKEGESSLDDTPSNEMKPVRQSVSIEQVKVAKFTRRNTLLAATAPFSEALIIPEQTKRRDLQKKREIANDAAVELKVQKANTLLQKPTMTKENLDTKAGNVATLIDRVLDVREQNSFYADQAHQAQMASLDSIKILQTADTANPGRRRTSLLFN